MIGIYGWRILSYLSCLVTPYGGCIYMYEVCVGNRATLLLLVGVSSCRGSGIHEDGGKEMVAGGTVSFRVEVGRVIVCVALAEDYGLVHDALLGVGCLML